MKKMIMIMACLTFSVLNVNAGKVSNTHAAHAPEAHAAAEYAAGNVTKEDAEKAKEDADKVLNWTSGRQNSVPYVRFNAG